MLIIGKNFYISYIVFTLFSQQKLFLTCFFFFISKVALIIITILHHGACNTGRINIL